jgi:DNA-binding transcriptional LysR family regulator
MDEKRLRYFLTVVEEQSVTRAANRLHVAQPSLSQALRALEGELGVELFHRAGRGLALSAAGEALIGPAREVLSAIDAARGAVSEVTEVLAGTLQIAALATLAVDPLATLIGRFRREYGGVVVRVQEPNSTAGVGAMVREGTCELGVARLPLPRDDLRTLELGRQELLFVLPPDTPLPGTDAPAAGRTPRGEARAGRGAGPSEDGAPASKTLRHRSPPTRSAPADGALAAETLRDIPLVVSPPGTSTRMLLEQALEAVGVIPRIAVEIGAREAIVPLVLAGAGAALLPAPLAREAGRRGAVVRAARPRIVRRIGLVHRDRQLSPAARAFVALTAG